MLTDIALIILVALLGNLIFIRVGVPGILGMVAAGVLLGPSEFDLIDPPVLELLEEFKTVALIVILIRAGLGISKETLNRIGGPAIRMGFVPGIVEGSIVTAASYYLLDLAFFEAGMLGFIIAAVSPAVVVPQMLELKEGGFGRKKEVPTIVLAEILLFVYIGAEVRIGELTGPLIITGLLILAAGLAARSLGVWISLLGSDLNAKERLFCVIAYWPKATVQAAMGAVPRRWSPKDV